MIKKVKIKIESVIDELDEAGLPVGDSDRSVSECEGVLRESLGDYSLRYTERDEGGEYSCEILCNDGGVSVRRSGAIVSCLHFCEGETTHSLYSIPPYSFDAALTAKRVRVDIGPDGGSIDLLYNLTLGGAEKSARMKIWISKSSNQD